MWNTDKSHNQANQVIARNVRAARNARGLTQTALGLRIKHLGAPRGLRQGSRSSIERATRCPSLDVLLLLAPALEVPVALLLEGVDAEVVRGWAKGGGMDGTTA
jgi:transcriptional regulator with XRE-family HTH domain